MNNNEYYPIQPKFGNATINVTTKPSIYNPNNPEQVGVTNTVNGQWGVGMYGVKLPANLYGPSGYQNYPLPYVYPLSAMSSADEPKYNASWANLPARNEDYFKQFIPIVPMNSMNTNGLFGKHCITMGESFPNNYNN
jgi:hypothetical protein